MADTFTVTNVRRTVNLTPFSDRRPTYEVAFTTKPHNIEGTVTIPVDEFTPEAVETAASEAAATLEAVVTL